MLLAEKLSLDRAIAAGEAPKTAPTQILLDERPKRKLNAAQVQQRKVRRQQIKLGDTLALAKDRVATEEDVKAYVRAKYAHLEEDEHKRSSRRFSTRLSRGKTKMEKHSDENIDITFTQTSGIARTYSYDA